MQLRQAIRDIIFFSIFAVIMLSGVVTFAIAEKETSGHNKDRLEDEWRLTLGTDEDYGLVSLDTFRLPHKIQKGEIITLEKKLPRTIIRNETMRLYVRQAAIKVYCNNEEIYSYGYDRLAEGLFVGTGYHFVDLPSTNGPADIVVRMTASEDGGFTFLPEIKMSSYGSAYTEFAKERLFSVFSGVFLFVLGISLSIVSLFYMSLDVDYFPLVMIGFISLLLGLWIMLSIGVLRLFSVDVSFNNMMEYTVMYFMVVPLILYSLHIRKKRGENILRVQIVSVISFLFALLAVVFHLTNTVYVISLNTAFEIGVILVFFFLLCDERAKFSDLSYSGKIFRIAMIFGMCATVADIIRFQLSIHMFPENRLLQTSIIPISALAFVGLLMHSYLSDLSTRLLRRAERDALTKLAYGDRMTGLSNRARSSVIFSELDSSGNPYGIINMDLNGLKTINDTYGHSQGDELICAFAGLIGRLFGGVGECVRMSGDEFIVVVRGKENMAKARDILLSLPEEEAKAGEKYSFTIDASYGLAESTEYDRPKAEEVYQTADRRMYDMKVKSKKGRS
ncbi:MAG: diguanylate cyclase [Lachnospiraceae bacterium]|nr:diguanylate cyclase [Lachnospiraceae bacterium]